MRKEIDFLAKIDTSEFDKAIEQIQRKVREAYRPGEQMQQQRATAQRLENIGLGGNMSKPSQDAMNKAMLNSRKEIDQLIAKEAKAQESISKELAAQLKNINALRDAQKQANGDIEKELALKKEIAAKEEAMYRTREEWKAKDSNLNQMVDARQKMSRGGIGGIMDAYGQGGMGGVAEKFGTTRMGLAGMALGGVSAALNFGAATYDQMGRSAFRTKINTGSAIQGTIGSTMQDMGNAYGQAWAPERLRAIQDASGQDTITRRNDLLRNGAGAAAIGGGAALAAGGTATVLGAIPSWLAGGASMLGGAGMMLGNERQRALTSSGLLSGMGNGLNAITGGHNFGAGNWLKGQGDQQMKEYNSVLAKEFAENFQQSLDAEQKSNPLKRLAAQNYGDNWQQYQGSQRAMGLDYNSFHGAGGFRERSINAGFTDQQGMAMSSGILGAGGSTDEAVNGSVFGMQMQRRGFTNSAGMLGALSGSMGSSQMSEQAMIKILAEGNRVGLDSSKFAEENRRFTQTVSEIVAGTGAKSGNSVDAVAGRFGSFMADSTNQGIQGAKSAYDQYQQISAETTGPRGVMRAAGFMRDKNLSKIDTVGKQALMQIPESDFNEENPAVRDAMRQSGLTIDELRDRVGKVNEGSQSRFKAADQARDKVRDYMKSKGISKISEADYGSMDEKTKAAYDKLGSYQTMELGDLGTKGNASRVVGAINGNIPLSQAAKDAQEADQRKKTTSSDTGRVEDQTNANIAESGRLALDSFRTFSKEMIPTVDAMKSFNAEMGKAVTSMKNMSSSDQDKMAATLSKMLGVRNAETQTQSGKTGQ